MGSYYRVRPTMRFGGFTLTPAVKVLLLVNAGLFIIPALLYLRPLHQTLPVGLVPALVLQGWVSQVFTYMFFHDGFMHLLFNMLVLWMFGTAVEQTWGTRRFTYYYLACGIFAGLSIVAAAWVTGSGMMTQTIGSSGALFGLIVAFGLLFPDAPILFMFLFPIPAKYFAMLMGFIEFYMQWTQPGSRVSHLAHLGGAVFGLIYIKLYLPRRTRRPKFRPAHRPGIYEDDPEYAPRERRFDLKGAYKRWKMRRARRKFEVYMRKHGGSGPLGPVN